MTDPFAEPARPSLVGQLDEHLQREPEAYPDDTQRM